MSDYRFGKLEDKLLRLCKANQPDYEKIQQRISEGASVDFQKWKRFIERDICEISVGDHDWNYIDLSTLDLH